MQKRFEPTQPGACDRMVRRLEETIFVRKSLTEPQATPQWVGEAKAAGSGRKASLQRIGFVQQAPR